MFAGVVIYGQTLDISFQKKITEVITQTLNDNGLVAQDFNIDVNFVSSKRMRELNSNFRKKDYATDVLSFGQFDDIVNDPPKGKYYPIMLGDLVLCKEVIVKEALEEDKSYEEHLLMLVEHGTLHLIGVHHPED